MKFAYLIEPPFNHIDPEGRVTGCDVDLARHVLSELGIEEFDPIETEFAELLPGLAAGRWRMTTGLFATEERRVHARFSRPIWALPDGLLVCRNAPTHICGYSAIANDDTTILAVVRDQFQHRSAREFGIPDGRIRVFDTYRDAAGAVRDGVADAYAGVGRAHDGFMGRHPDWRLENRIVPTAEKSPAFGSFAFSLSDAELCDAVDAVLATYLGSDAHRLLAAQYGFSGAEIDLVVGAMA